MKLFFIGSFLALLTLSCNQPSEVKTEVNVVSPPKDTTSKKDTASYYNSKEEDDIYNGWVNELVGEYMLHNINELIQLNISKNDTASPEVWMNEGMDVRNGTTYYMCHIGHLFSDEDGSRFVTDGWAYVDSAKRVLYEYDVANDSLIVWKK